MENTSPMEVPSEVHWRPLAALGCAVGVVEILAEQTITESFREAMAHDKWRYVAVGSLIITAAHLMDCLPKQIDPYHYIASGLSRLKKV